MKTILFKTIIIAFFVGTAVSCSDEDENRFRPGSTHEKPNPTEPEGGLDYSKLTADNHPRLLMNAEAFTALKAKVDANSSANLTLLHNTIMGVCNSKGMNATALTYKLDASNKRILDVSRDALLRIFTCAYAYRMTGDAKYLTKAETDMNAVCNFPDWNSKRHFLDVGEMATAVAFGYDWLYNELSAATRTKAANALLKFAFQQAQNKNWNLNFYEATNNWNQVCNGGLVCAALASYENNPSEAKDMIEKALESNKPALEVMYSPDGNYPEGSGYWCYGTLYQVLMLAALNSTLGTDNGLSDTPGFSKTAEYMLYMTGLNSKFFNYSDCAPSSTAALASWWFADKYSNPSLLYNELKMLKNGEYASCAENRLLPMIMAFANNLNLDAISAPSNKLWSGKGETPVVMVHTDWTYTDTDKYLGIKGGKAGSSHGHMDAGSFIFERDGVRWAMDLGMQSYITLESKGVDLWNMSQNGQRWEVFRLSNIAHNTLTINGERHLVESNAPITRTFESKKQKGAEVDLSTVFANSVKKAVRTVILDQKDHLEVIDRLETRDKEATVSWIMVTPAEAKITGKNRIELTKDGQRMLLTADTGTEVEMKIWSNVPPHEYDFRNPGTIRVGFETVIPANRASQLKVRLIPLK